MPRLAIQFRTIICLFAALAPLGCVGGTAGTGIRGFRSVDHEPAAAPHFPWQKPSVHVDCSLSLPQGSLEISLVPVRAEITDRSRQAGKCLATGTLLSTDLTFYISHGWPGAHRIPYRLETSSGEFNTDWQVLKTGETDPAPTSRSTSMVRFRLSEQIASKRKIRLLLEYPAQKIEFQLNVDNFNQP